MSIVKYKERYNPRSGKEILDLYIDFASKIEPKLSEDVFLGGKYIKNHFTPSWNFDRLVESEANSHESFNEYEKKPYSLPYGESLILNKKIKEEFEKIPFSNKRLLDENLDKEIIGQRLYIIFQWTKSENYYYPELFEEVLRYNGFPKAISKIASYFMEMKKSSKGARNIETVGKEILSNLNKINPEGSYVKNLGPSDLYYYGDRFFLLSDKCKENWFGNNEYGLTMNFGYGICTKDGKEVIGYKALKYNPTKEISDLETEILE